MVIRKIYGCRARFCCDGCADGFRTDRRYGLIYPSYQVELDDGTHKIMGVEQASIAAKFCAYCNEDLDTKVPA